MTKKLVLNLVLDSSSHLLPVASLGAQPGGCMPGLAAFFFLASLLHGTQVELFPGPAQTPALSLGMSPVYAKLNERSSWDPLPLC